MTAATITTPGAAPLSAPSALANKLRWGIADTLTMTKRNLIIWFRVPAYIVFTLVQPVMFMMLFKYVFGGAIRVISPGGYVDYLMPGVIAQTAAFTSFGSGISLAQELQKGSIDRLKSMPMARSAVLLGRLGADMVRMGMTIVVIIASGYAVGFRFHNGAAPAVLMVAVALCVGLLTACVSAFVGLVVKDEESVQAFSIIWVFPFCFVSAAFVQIQSMPGWLQAFAKNQPISIFIEEMRALIVGGPLVLHGWESAAWMVGLLALFGSLAVRTYRRV